MEQPDRLVFRKHVFGVGVDFYKRDERPKGEGKKQHYNGDNFIVGQRKIR
jgi:hypothetical protein